MTTNGPRPERHPDRMTWWDTTWRIGAALFMGATFWLFTVAVAYPEGGPEPEGWRAPWLVFGDPALGLLAAGLLVLRRRWPIAITTLTTLLVGASTTAAGAQAIALVSLATRQRWREIVPMTILTTVMGLVSARFIYPEPDPLPLWAETLINFLVNVLIVAIGYSIGSRRALVRSWVERAETAEAEQRARVARAQASERTRIAREMHDVLAHRISLVTMHSGMLVYREDLPDAERREAITAIDTNARAALTDLREVLGVLREEEGTGPLRPQSTLADLSELLEEARAAGTRVLVDDEDVDLDAVPEYTGRTAYRVVQEGLTNARKHAAGATVSIAIAGDPDDGLRVVVSNPRAVGTAHEAPSSGLGLLGLAERVELAGGRLEHGWTPEGRHRLAVWIPWTP
ncbi:MAG TPA: two-component sensor histidine kinase [Candidatus Janibacter merdipullorum]|nr:two-component sensor histidine kinase [Candidatus Janibacter merdipullorum]